MRKEMSEENKRRLEAIACYFRELRFSDGLTQAEVGENVNLHENTIARIENAKNVTLTTIFDLADYYQIPTHQIFNE